MTPPSDLGRSTTLVDRLGIVLLALLAYVPSLASARGRIPADTKLYLYLDPGRLLADSLWSWDDRQFAGWVPHQTIGYLWPSGPWFWTMERLGLPDWVAHRLWIGTIVFVAGLGVRWCARRFGLTGLGVVVAAVVYQLSPYVLPYISRTSVLLLPWAGLGWLIGLTARAARRGGWRDPILFALVVATVGGINATAMAMIAPAPLLWLADSAWRRELNWKQAGAVALRIGGLSIAASMWWLVALWVQATYGAPVLSYSETLEAVSFTSLSSEALRGLGYWLFYVSDPTGPLTSTGVDYQVSTMVMAAGWFVILVGVAGLIAVRWRARRFAIVGILVAIVLAVGTHPIGDSSPLTQPLARSSTSTLTLAIRSSTRAVPLAVLCLALGAGALVSALHIVRPRLAHLVGVLVMVLALVNLPALRTGQFVDPGLEHPQIVPEAWSAVAAALDELPAGHRTLQLPGTESAVARWGTTVDPVLPGITEREVVQRDWLPLGSAPAMDLFYALDARFHDGTLDPAALAPVARLFGADSIVFAGDVAFEKFRTARPEVTWATYEAVPSGLGAPTPYGTPLVNIPSVAMLDERALADPRVGTSVPELAVVPVVEPVPIARIKTGTTVIVGSGDGVVNASAAGLLDGTELLRYAASLDDDELDSVVAVAESVIVTDSNRKRARNWRGSRDTDGFLELVDQPVLRPDPTDHRLPLFPEDRSGDQTVVELEGPLVASATGYGSPTAAWPERRAALAVDGDPATAWTVGERAEVVGEYLRLDLTTPQPVTTVWLTQPVDGANRWVTDLVVRTDTGTQSVILDESSRTPAGQPIPIGAATSFIELEIAATNAGVLPQYVGFSGVGFAEVRIDALPPTREIVRVPQRLGAVAPSAALSYVFDRWRVDAMDRWRDDPERGLVRRFSVPGDHAAVPSAVARISPRAGDAVLGALLGVPPGTSASSRLAGVPSAGPWAAIDQDPATAWTSGFGDAAGATLTVPIAPDAPLSALTIQLVDDAEHSRPTELSIEAGGRAHAVELPDDSGVGPLQLVLPDLTGDLLTIRVVGVEERTTIDRRTGEPVALPVAIAEVASPGGASFTLPPAIDTGCREDLLALDGSPIAVRLTGPTADAISGTPLAVEFCAGPLLGLTGGKHLLEATPGFRTGFDLDRVVLAAPVAASRQPGGLAVTSRRTRGARRIDAPACPAGCWLVSGDGWNPGWSATADGRSLGEPVVVDGGFNGWWLPASPTPSVVELRWAPQRRIWVGLGISIATVLGGLLVLLIGNRRAEHTEPLAAPEWFHGWLRRGRCDWGPVVVAGVLGMVLIRPMWGLLAAGVCLPGALLARRRLTAMFGGAVLAGVGAFDVLQQRAERAPPGFGWVVNVESAHRPTLLALVVLAAAALSDEDLAAGREQRIRSGRSWLPSRVPVSQWSSRASTRKPPS